MPFLRGRFLGAVVAALVFTLGACETVAPQRPVYPPIVFQDQPRIRLDVGEIKVESRYRAPGSPPNVDHLFPVSLLEAAQRWPNDRLAAAAAGSGNRAEFVILDASVVAVPLKTTSGLTALITKDHNERYDARITVEMRILDGFGGVAASARAEAVRSRSVREDITLRERDQVWYEMTRDIMRELDRQLLQTIKTALVPYIL